MSYTLFSEELAGIKGKKSISLPVIYSIYLKISTIFSNPLKG